MRRVTLGSDPEVFVKKAKTGEIIPADKVAPSKRSPATLPCGTKFFYDGFGLEFNPAPVETPEAFTQIVTKSLEELKAYLQEKDCEMDITPTVATPYATLIQAVDEAQMFGCDPDQSVYSMGILKKPAITNARTHYFRYAGGHVHIGLPDMLPKVHDCGQPFTFMSSFEGWKCKKCNKLANTAKLQRVIVALDGLAAKAIVEKESKINNAWMRRQYYGMLGSFRFQPHGVEWRFPSNYWLASAGEIGWIAEQAVKAVAIAEKLDTIVQDAKERADLKAGLGHLANYAMKTNYSSYAENAKWRGKDICVALAELLH
jgi:hypothetical protein